MTNKWINRVMTLQAVLWGAVFCGCSTMPGHKAELDAGQAAFRKGSITEAGERLESFAEANAESPDAVLAYCEIGNVCRFNGETEKSLKYFDECERRIMELDRSPEFSVSGEGAAALTNLRALPYRGKNYERIMLNTYKALAYMETGEVDRARVELNKAYQWQKEAAHRNRKRIEKAQAAAKAEAEDGEKQGYDVQRARRDEKLSEGLEQLYESAESCSPYSDYVNPFCEWLQGLYYMAAPADSADLEHARKRLSRVKEMAGDNRYVDEDLALADSLAKGKKFPATTYVIFATGNVPEIGQIRLDIPLFVVTDQVDYVGVNFPRLVPDDTFVDRLTVRANGGEYDTELLADMDSVAAREFKDALPVVVTKTLLSSGLKAGLATAVRSAAGDNAIASTVARFGGVAYQAATNLADTRSWESLPKQFQYARLPTPGTGTVVVVPLGEEDRELSVAPGETNLVFIRSFEPGQEIRVSQFTLQ